MAKTAPKKQEETNNEAKLTREALCDYINDISQKMSIKDESRIHCAIALNQLLVSEESVSLIDEELKKQLTEIWLKLKNEGIQLDNPPVLFGLPEDFQEAESLEN